MASEPPAPYRWLGHSTLFFPGPPPVAVDPWKWRTKDLRADLILLTSGHVDHCSEEDLRRASHDRTVFAAPPSAAVRVEAVFPGRVTTLSEGDVFEHPGVRVTALPSAGPVRDGRPCGFVLRGEGLSYLVETDAGRFLALGDSTALAEHEGLSPDVVFLAISGLVVMDPEEAADAAERVGAGLAVPVAWGDLHGRYPIALEFEELCSARGIPARLARASG